MPTAHRLLLSHGNGFASDLYYPFWSLLLDRFDIIVYDVRNHGWNPVGDRRRHNVPTFVQDSQNILASVGRLFGNKPTIGVFHSLSAVVAMLHQRQTRGFAALVLFDPPVGHLRQPDDYIIEVGGGLAEMTRRRKTRFSSRDELVESVSRSRPFRKASPEVPVCLPRRRCGRRRAVTNYAARPSTRRRATSISLAGLTQTSEVSIAR